MHRTYPGYPDKPDLSNQPEASPLFLSITSEGDAATSIALPIGQTAERFTMKTRDYGDAADPPEIPNQSTYFTHSAANIPALHSHQVRLHGCAEGEVEVHLGSSNPAPYHFCEVPTAPMPGMPYWNHTPLLDRKNSGGDCAGSQRYLPASTVQFSSIFSFQRVASNAENSTAAEAEHQMKLTRREALLMPFAAALQAKSHIPREYSEIGLPVQGPEHHRVFYTKTDGPPVVILHEITGLSPADLDFGLRVAAEHFTVYVPLIFGGPAQNRFVINGLESCVGGQIACFAKNGNSHAISWLRPMCREISARHQGHPVGVIGMCETGGFPIALLREPSVHAAILSQPALPFGSSKAAQDALGISQDDLAYVRDQRKDVTVIGLRFDGDCICTAERFRWLKAFYGEQFQPITIPSHGQSMTAHSQHAVLTFSYDPTVPELKQAFETVIAELRKKLTV